jgi:hypothetical protein
MKIVSILTCFLIVILTAGCSQVVVVYRVHPASPPQMGVEEAREALVLSLSRAQIPAGLVSIKLQGDDLVAERTSARGAQHPFSKSGFDDISQEVGKEGENYFVNVRWRALSGRGRDTYYWKSEEDARSFVDAAHALRRARFQKSPIKTE